MDLTEEAVLSIYSLTWNLNAYLFHGTYPLRLHIG